MRTTPLSHRDVGRFDERASRYDESWLQRRFFQPVYEATVDVALDASPHPTRVLDVGCGTGRLLSAIGRRVPDAELVGVDPAANMLRRAMAAGGPDGAIQVVRGSAEALPVRDDRFDLVLSTASFHHWADQQAGLRDVRRVLAPDGAFVLTDAIVEDVVKGLLAVVRPGRFHSDAELAATFERTGFEVTASRWVPEARRGGNGFRATVGRPA